MASNRRRFTLVRAYVCTIGIGFTAFGVWLLHVLAGEQTRDAKYWSFVAFIAGLIFVGGFTVAVAWFGNEKRVDELAIAV